MTMMITVLHTGTIVPAELDETLPQKRSIKSTPNLMSLKMGTAEKNICKAYEI